VVEGAMVVVEGAMAHQAKEETLAQASATVPRQLKVVT